MVFVEVWLVLFTFSCEKSHGMHSVETCYMPKISFRIWNTVMWIFVCILPFPILLSIDLIAPRHCVIFFCHWYEWVARWRLPFHDSRPLFKSLYHSHSWLAKCLIPRCHVYQIESFFGSFSSFETKFHSPAFKKKYWHTLSWSQVFVFAWQQICVKTDWKTM